jgi:hypothetical protein
MQIPAAEAAPVRHQPYNPGYAETQPLFAGLYRQLPTPHEARGAKIPWAEWELRFGPGNRFRVFYQVQAQAVIILALGEKVGKRLFVEGKEVES